jgi:hypothetical protein
MHGKQGRVGDLQRDSYETRGRKKAAQSVCINWVSAQERADASAECAGSYDVQSFSCNEDHLTGRSGFLGGLPVDAIRPNG